MYFENKNIAARINEIATNIAKSNSIKNEWGLINKIYEEELKDAEVKSKVNSKSKNKNLIAIIILLI